MPTKRRNHGRSKKNKGHSINIRCTNCGRCCPKDKAVKRFHARNIVDSSSKRDIKENFAYKDEEFYVPKIYYKMQYCIACAIHSRVVRVRSTEDKKIRYTTKKRGAVEKKTSLNKPKPGEQQRAAA